MTETPTELPVTPTWRGNGRQPLFTTGPQGHEVRLLLCGNVSTTAAEEYDRAQLDFLDSVSASESIWESEVQKQCTNLEAALPAAERVVGALERDVERVDLRRRDALASMTGEALLDELATCKKEKEAAEGKLATARSGLADLRKEAESARVAAEREALGAIDRERIARLLPTSNAMAAIQDRVAERCSDLLDQLPQLWGVCQFLDVLRTQRAECERLAKMLVSRYQEDAKSHES